MNLKKKELWQEKAFINGQWIDHKGGDYDRATFEIVNPANGEVIAQVADMDESDTQIAIEAAQAAFAPWRDQTAKERSKVLKEFYRLIMDNVDDLAQILTAEQGKPLHEARGEIAYGAAYIEWYAEEAKRVYGDVIPTHKKGARVLALRQACGVVGAITPWNFPSAMITRKIAPALAAGCSVVLKPAEDTPLSALALAVLAKEAGLPDGLLNIVPCSRDNAPQVGAILCSHKDVKKISFTGSTEIGKILMQQSASTVKKVSMELGGNAPFIVFKSADLEEAASGLIACKFRNAGQTCVSANRIYVHEDVYDAFCAIVSKKIAAMKLGKGDESGVDVGPLINQKGFDKVASIVKDALGHGASIVCGGLADKKDDTLFFPPTLLRDMDDTMDVSCNEIFGPVAALFRFKDEDDVVRRANDTPFGLASYFYSQDMAQCFRVAEALDYGMVGVNEPLLSAEAAPFGGVKESGIGREGSKYGIDDYTDIKYVLLGGL
jgi:succinate-semialdehyde dehydrogenase/glutarate-semialdehyde dehydrogenase